MQENNYQLADVFNNAVMTIAEIDFDMVKDECPSWH